MIEVESLPFCYKSTTTVNVQQLLTDVTTLTARLNLSEATISNWFSRRFDKVTYPINLTHPPGLTSNISKALGYREGHAELLMKGVDEIDFTEIIDLIDDLYLGEIVRTVYTIRSNFRGRTQLSWLGPKRQFPFHKDFHTPNRYHIPLVTNPGCYWLFKWNNEVYKLHMPADGAVWYVDPTIEHTFVNDSDQMRLHVLFTSVF